MRPPAGRPWRGWGAAALAVALCSAPRLATPQDTGEVVVREGRLAGNQYLAGGSVDVLGAVDGNLAAAGGQVGVGGAVSGDVLAAGALVYVGGAVGGDVRALGGRVLVTGPVGGDVLAAGGEVVLRRHASIDGRALLGAGRVRVLGRIGRGLLAGGEVVEIDGAVGGDVRVRARYVSLGPGARIEGDLVVDGGATPRIDPAARIRGRVRVEAPQGEGARGVLGKVLRAAALQLGMLLAAWAWLVLAPGVAREAGRVARSEPTLSLGLGVAVLLGLPLAAVALAITVVGIPVAVAAGAAWLLAGVAGYCAAAVRLGDGLRTVARREPPRLLLGTRLAWTLLALLLLRALEAIPVLGPAVAITALVLGTGAVARAVQLLRARAGAGTGVP
jgi:hypothetical protein